VRFHLHRFGSSVLVRRYAPEAQASVKDRTGARSVRVRFTAKGAPAAVGFEFEADGFHLDVALPGAEALAPQALSPELRAACRTAYLRNRILSDPLLPSDANAFQRDWLYQILLAGAIVRAYGANETIGTAACAVADDAQALKRAMAVMFSVQDPLTADEEYDELAGAEPPEPAGSGDGSEQRAHRLLDTLADLIDRPELRARLADLACELEEPDAAAWDAWMRETLLQTLGEALLQACTAAAPRHTATDTLLVDVENLPSGAARIWVTETTLGGAGVIQEFAKAFAEEPRALFRAVEAALAPTDLELATEGLERFLALTAEHPEIAELAGALRAAPGHDERDRLRRELWERLAAHGLDVPRALAVSLDARLLRAGSGGSLDATLRDLLERWNALEARLGIAIELRAMSQLAAADKELAALVRELVRETAPSVPLASVNVAQVLSALLWPRAVEVRRKSLDSYNPYRTRKPTDPALVRRLFVDEQVQEIPAGAPGWRDALVEALQRNGTARLWSEAGTPETLRAAMLEMTTEPIVFGYVRLFAAVERVERDGSRMVAMLSVREAV